MTEVTAMLLSEQRRYPQLSYKSDVIFISGLDEGDRRALEKFYRGSDPPCQLDPEDNRFVLKGPKFNPLTVINILSMERGYKIMYNPQQHGIPLKQGSTDDKFALVFFLSKKLEPTNDSPNQPPVPQRVDSLTSVASNPPDVVSEP